MLFILGGFKNYEKPTSWKNVAYRGITKNLGPFEINPFFQATIVEASTPHMNYNYHFSHFTT